MPRIAPKSPADSLKAFRIHPGFRIELVAAEPLLASPVALDFDEDGRLYVAEFVDFNQKLSKTPRGHGRVRLLDDTDGDGKADVRRVIYSGFGYDPGGEALLNSFRWLFDNRIHVATSNSGRQIRRADKQDAKPVSVRGQGLIFDPRTEEFELTSGGGQHGMSIDDWGRKFVCTSHYPVFLVMYDGRYLARNPYVEAPAAAVRIGPGGYTAKVTRISPNEPWRVLRTRWRTTGVEDPHPTEGDQPSGYFSAASGVTVYRGDAWPAEYRGNVFVGEVANNLIYRARIEPNGVGLTARRADTAAEFLASTDVWFRPVQMANGPDGALYVLDMYRGLIEAAEFASVTLTAPDGKSIPAQVTGPGLTSGAGGEFYFILPHLAAGDSLRLTGVLSTDKPSAGGFAWYDQPGKHTQLRFGERPIVTYHYERLDESTPARRVRTYKVFHHLYSPLGDRIVTNGLSDDPKVHSPHHRGIFYGFNRITYGNGKTADVWHCTGGAYQEHEGFLAAEEGPVLGRHRVSIGGHGNPLPGTSRDHDA